MRICLLLPRFSPAIRNSPVARVIRKFPQTYQTGLAVATSALSQGHTVQAVLIGPDPHHAERAAFSSGTSALVQFPSSREVAMDPAISHLLAAFPEQFSVSCALPPSQKRMKGGENGEDEEDGGIPEFNFVDALADPNGSQHWVQAIAGAAEPGVHVVVDALGAEVCGGCKYALSDEHYNTLPVLNNSNNKSDKNVINEGDEIVGQRTHKWNRVDFPDSEALVKGMCQFYAANKLVASLSSAETMMRRAPEPTVIPPTVKDRSKIALPSKLQFANTAEMTKTAEEIERDEQELKRALSERQERRRKEREIARAKGLSEEDIAAIEAQEDAAAFADEDFPVNTLVLSLTSWRLLSMAEWHKKRVLWLPWYNGGDSNEVCVAACEDIYRYFQDMFKQRTFTDFSFIGVPPLLKEGMAETASSPEELTSMARSRIRMSRMSLLPETVPFDVFRIAGLLPTKLQSHALGIAAATSDCPGFSTAVCADDLGDSIVEELVRFMEDDRAVRMSVFNYRGVLEQRRDEEKQHALRLASKRRFAFKSTNGAPESNMQRYSPLAWMWHAKMLERMYSNF